MSTQPDADATGKQSPTPSFFELWKKYEDVTMHFNDLIIRLRFQALAGVAGISALVGVFGRQGTDAAFGSKMLGGIFLLLLLFWIAIWLLDRLYYDKLLTGAVAALLKLERESATAETAHIELSTIIEKSFMGDPVEIRRPCFFKDGRNWFYLIVTLTLLLGSLLHFLNVKAVSASR